MTSARMPIPLCSATARQVYLRVSGPVRCNAPAVHRGDLDRARCGMHVDVCGRCDGETRVTATETCDDGRLLSVRMRRVRCRRCDGQGVVDPAALAEDVA